MTRLVRREVALPEFDLTADQFGAAIESVQHEMAGYLRANRLRPTGGVRVRLTVPVEPEGS